MSRTTIPFNPGRHGDVRMHKAVAARLDNPNLSLFEALTIGGFQYATDDPGAVDGDGVRLSQRKNQLLRRLRTARRPEPHNHATTTTAATSLVANLEEAVQHQQRQQQQDQLAAGNHSMEVPPGSANAVIEPLLVSNIEPFPLSSIPSMNLASHSQPLVHNTRPASSGLQPSTTPATIQSLQNTAAAAGVSLDQLATSLQSPPVLSRVLSARSRQEVALCYYQSESTAVYRRAMAQFQLPAEHFLQFAADAWSREGQRLMTLMHPPPATATATTLTTPSSSSSNHPPPPQQPACPNPPRRKRSRSE